MDVVACGASCRPDASFVVETPPELDVSTFSPPFSGPGYLLTTELTLRGSIFDADAPPDNPIQFWWELLPPCVAPEITPCPPAIPLDNGSVVVTGFPALADLTFRPGEHVAEWAECQIHAREYTFVVGTNSFGWSAGTGPDRVEAGQAVGRAGRAFRRRNLVWRPLRSETAPSDF